MDRENYSGQVRPAYLKGRTSNFKVVRFLFQHNAHMYLICFFLFHLGLAQNASTHPSPRQSAQVHPSPPLSPKFSFY